jgi:hypothetical protein
VKVARALISFIDGSYLFVEMAKKVAPTDAVLFLEKVVGLPEGAPADKPTIAVALQRMTASGPYIEVLIPMARVNGIQILEEFLGKQVASDIEALWTTKERGK